MTPRLYSAAEIRVGDEVPGVGVINRIERSLGEIRLYSGQAITLAIRVGPDTPILATRRHTDTPRDTPTHPPNSVTCEIV